MLGYLPSRGRAGWDKLQAIGRYSTRCDLEPARCIEQRCKARCDKML